MLTRAILKNAASNLIGAKNIDELYGIFWAAKAGLLRFIRLAGQGFKYQPTHYQISEFSQDRRQVFFGYYDVSPFSSDGQKLLAICAPLANVRPGPRDTVEIGWYHFDDLSKKFHTIDQTTTWCWQMGCRLQWYPADSNDSVVYNRLVDGKYGCVIRETYTRKIVRTINHPVYSVSRDGKYGLTLNFSRLHRLRPGYGYANLPDLTVHSPAPADDGIWRIDLATGREDFLFSVSDIAGSEPLPSMEGAEHYFNHICFNPTGTRFMFFHLWLKDGKRNSRLITSNINGNDRCILTKTGAVSHYTWHGNRELLVTSRQPDGLVYYLFEDESSKHQIIGSELLKGDSHPTLSDDGTRLLFDTYPDELRDQHLGLLELETGKITILGTFFSPGRFKGEVRCDLHPRWDQQKNRVCFDSSHGGKRAMYVMQL